MTVTPASPVATSPPLFIPRGYQEEIFRKAQDGNIIAALDTGSGKTYISMLLIKWIATLESSRGKLIVFLVPKVPLVEQQGNFIERHTSLRVAQIHGGVAVNILDRSKWKGLFAKTDVLVMTAQIFLNILTHSHWSLKKVSLIIIDECHHTRKNHPYNGVMKEYFQCHAFSRPKIFGMTASPTWNTRNPEEALATLEKNMDAKVITVKQHAEELLEHSPKPIEVIRQYPPPPEKFLEYPFPSIWSRFDREILPRELDIPWSKLQMRYDVAWHSLGPFAAELYLHSDLRARISQSMNATDANEMEILRLKFLSVDGIDDAAPTQAVKPVAPEVRDLGDLLEEYHHFLQFEYDEEDLPGPWAFNMDWCTPKVQVLIETLLAHHTPAFQGIVFVEQRHIATCLARLLSRVPQLKGIIKCAECVGHGNDTTGTGTGMRNNKQRDIVRDFRSGLVNLLIATPVAEEGLDFPACDLVVRFDSIQHMVGYVQSRGRARHKSSTFVIMVQEGNTPDITRYKTFLESEPEIKQLYQAMVLDTTDTEENDGVEEVSVTDLAARERFIVPSTGAILSYNTAIGLLGHLCSLIPCDSFTSSPQPKYEGDFISTLRLPNALPLPSEQLLYVGPQKHSKKEAKRAVAFMAVKALHALNVFDDYLLPTRSAKEHSDDVDGRVLKDVSSVPELMTVTVRDPWTLGQQLWTHPISCDGHQVAAIVTGSLLPPVELAWDGHALRTHEGELVQFDDERRERALLQDYTDLALWWFVSSRPRATPLSCYCVPTRPNSSQPDFEAMERQLEYPHGNYDWSGINEGDYDHVLFMNNKEHGRPYLIHTIRHDLTPMSKPPEGSRESDYDTFWDYFRWKFIRRGVIPEVPQGGPLIEAYHFPRQTSSAYHLTSFDGPADFVVPPVDPRPFYLPFSFCRWFSMPEDMFRLYHLLPRILHRVSDVWRARNARFELGLPPIVDDLLIEAFTLPSAGAGFSNQRLETLGDAVLKLCTSVHLFNRFPYRHEGQLDALRRSSISNRTLLARAKDNGLEHHLSGEKQNLKTWRFVVSEESPSLDGGHTDRHAHRLMARRSLQDCMEASLGASYLTGGLPMVLQTGTALGLNFGGAVPWPLRYSRPPNPAYMSPLFYDLQTTLDYEFNRPELLLEAMTHPSFPSTGTSYQRLEFLGDAVIDLVVMTYLHKKFPRATSGQLSCARSRGVCAPVLASVAVRRLGLHKLILVNNAQLSMAIDKYVPVLESISSKDIVLQSWAHDPPKAISDVMESLVAAILIDSAYNLDKTAVVVELIMEDILDVLSPDLRPDPVSELMVWTAQSGCHRMYLQKSRSRSESKQNDTVCVIVHDITVAGPVTASNLSVARAFASERARVVLQDDKSEKSLVRLCDCACALKDAESASALFDEDVDELAFEETETGFATLAQRKLEDLFGPAQDDEPDADDEVDSLFDEPRDDYMCL